MPFPKLVPGAVCAALLGSPALAQQAEIVQHQDWTLACEAGSTSGGRQCMMRQVLLNPRTDAPILVVMIAFNEHNRTAPLHAFNLPRTIPRDGIVTFQVDDRGQHGLPVLACNEEMCTALAKLPADVAGEFKRGLAATVTMPLPDGRRIALTMPLRGFTAAYETLEERNRG